MPPAFAARVLCLGVLHLAAVPHAASYTAGRTLEGRTDLQSAGTAVAPVGRTGFQSAVPADPAVQQAVEIDRILQRVGGEVITTLHVRRARLLRLVTPEADTDQAIQREIENRRLMLAEVERFSREPPADVEVAERRREWERLLPPGTDVPELLARAGMSEASLETWLRDDLRLRAYLSQRFGTVAAADRTAAIASWIRSLRERAGLR